MSTEPQLYSFLTPQERRALREDYVKDQKGLCYWCKHPLTEAPSNEVQRKPLNLRLFPKGFLSHPIHLQHCHKTGLTEGAVHAYCNGIMWQYHQR